MERNKSLGVCSIVALILSSAAAIAAPKADQCRSIVDPAQRLACYDAREGTTSGSVEPGTVERQKAAFGLNERIKAQEERREVEQISATIKHVGGRNLTLDNGQTWKTQSGSRLIEWVLPGQAATISHGRFGGYRLRIKSVPGVEYVTRVE